MAFQELKRGPFAMDVRFGSLADIAAALSNVRFTPKADIAENRPSRPAIRSPRRRGLFGPIR